MSRITSAIRSFTSTGSMPISPGSGFSAAGSSSAVPRFPAPSSACARPPTAGWTSGRSSAGFRTPTVPRKAISTSRCARLPSSAWSCALSGSSTAIPPTASTSATCTSRTWPPTSTTLPSTATPSTPPSPPFRRASAAGSSSTACRGGSTWSAGVSGSRRPPSSPPGRTCRFPMFRWSAIRGRTTRISSARCSSTEPCAILRFRPTTWLSLRRSSAGGIRFSAKSTPISPARSPISRPSSATCASAQALRSRPRPR